MYRHADGNFLLHVLALAAAPCFTACKMILNSSVSEHPVRKRVKSHIRELRVNFSAAWNAHKSFAQKKTKKKNRMAGKV